MSEELKHCPFCGSADVKAENGHCTCQDCGANAVKRLWNTRHEDHDNLINWIRKLKRLLVIRDIHLDRFQTYQEHVDNIIKLSDKNIDSMTDDIIQGIGYKYNGDYWHCRLPWESMGK